MGKFVIVATHQISLPAQTSTKKLRGLITDSGLNKADLNKSTDLLALTPTPGAPKVLVLITPKTPTTLRIPITPTTPTAPMAPTTPTTPLLGPPNLNLPMETSDFLRLITI